MLFAIGFAATFLLGGMTGVLLASPPLDFHVTDTYFVVAHFHYVLFGTIVFATFSGIYFWFPKMTGRMMDETLGKVHFCLTFVGFHATFLVQHWLGNEGMPRRYADYLSCPPPRHDFTELPRIRSERPAFELHHPHLVEQFLREAHVDGHPAPSEAAAERVGREEQPDADPRSR
ncbi:MAG: hypothetical protein ABT15_00730 [Pseudonocardia sp. SCN 73-27]|nr:MAG: hypothetical protein ABS80_06105 [Pseudonocardia sp. SCN 72-51]ODV09170.1 MAG: hypothetical protein ABT15_00730 [Pseudonocardia sp. SCN 73-27]